LTHIFRMGSYHVAFSLPIKTTDTLVMDNSKQIASQLTHLQGQKSSTVHWCSFSDWGCYRVAVCFHYEGWEYIDYAYQRANRFPIKLLTSPKIVDAPETLSIHMSYNSLYGQWFCTNNHIVIIDSQFIIFLNTELHPKALWRLNVWSTDAHDLWAMDNIALSHSSAFSWQFTACRSIHSFLINIAKLPHFALCSSFSSIFLTYHKQFSKYSLSAPRLNAGWRS